MPELTWGWRLATALVVAAFVGAALAIASAAFWVVALVAAFGVAILVPWVEWPRE